MRFERTIDVESASLRAIDRLLRREIHEDGVFEFKRELTETTDISRQLAGHANAARRHPIIWIIGYDEKDLTYHGPCTINLEKWWPSVEKRFDGPAPEPLPVPFLSEDGKGLLALRFLTDQAPYVVKVPDTDRLEIPFRVANATRSATRSQLLRILTPSIQKPEIEIIDAGATLTPRASQDDLIELWLRLFITPSEPLTYPAHKRRGIATGFSGMSAPAQLYDIKLGRPETTIRDDPNTLSLPDQTTIYGPALIHITARGDYRHVDKSLPMLTIEFDIQASKEEHNLHFNFGLIAAYDQQVNFLGEWILVDPLTRQRLLPLA